MPGKIPAENGTVHTHTLCTVERAEILRLFGPGPILMRSSI
nr:MAG TPA: hypothetical protein [Caudoviricetes sp.]